jgi:hypothetical protein
MLAIRWQYNIMSTAKTAISYLWRGVRVAYGDGLEIYPSHVFKANNLYRHVFLLPIFSLKLDNKIVLRSRPLV